jgi:septum formation protein
MPTPTVPNTVSQLPSWVWLASRSPRRKELLETLGIEARVFLAQNAPEAEALETPQPDEDPLLYVQRVTHLKLNAAVQALHAQNQQGIVLVADTTVALNQRILGKPVDAEEAHNMLSSLSDTTHQVHTAVAVCNLSQYAHTPSVDICAAVQTSQVHFSSIPKAFIEAYIRSGEPFDKAGGYGIQGIMGQYTQYISGSHSGIMGLPLFETSELLRKAWLQTNHPSGNTTA